MVKPVKIQWVEETRKKFLHSEGVILVDFTGLSSSKEKILRRTLKKEGVEVKVGKNRLFLRAVAETPYAQSLSPYFTGSSMVFFIQKNFPQVARKLRDLLKTEDIPLRIKLLSFGATSFRGEELDAVCSLPTREELAGKLAFLLRAPVQTLVQTLQSPLFRFLLILREISTRKFSSEKGV
jgi:large subunit ribosomal protein L10